MEIPHFVKTVEEMENETELGTKIGGVQERIEFYQHLVAISEAPHLTVPGGKNMTPHADSKGGISLLGVRSRQIARSSLCVRFNHCTGKVMDSSIVNRLAEMKGAAKTRSTRESKQKGMEIPHFVKTVEEMENETELGTKIGGVQERIEFYQHLVAISGAPHLTVPGGKNMTPHAEMKGAAKTRSTRESKQKGMEIPHFVKTVEEMENETGEQSHPQAGLQLPESKCSQGKVHRETFLWASSEATSVSQWLLSFFTGRTTDGNTARVLESIREEVGRILTEKLAVLQSQVEVSQHAAPPLEEVANNQASLQAISEKMQSLVTSLQNVEASRKQDLEILRAEMQGKISNDLEAAKRSWSEEILLEIDNKLGRTTDGNTARVLESIREEVGRILTEKLAVLQSQVEVSQHAAPPLEEVANNQASLQAISEKMQSLVTSLQNVEASRKQDLEILRAEMQGKISNDLEAAKRSWSEEILLEIDNKLGRTTDGNTARVLESIREEVGRILTEKLAVLQSQLEVSQHAAPPLEEVANNQASLQAISEKMQSLVTSLQNVEASRKQDLEILRAEMQGKISNDLEAAKRSWSEEILLEIDNKLGRTVDRNTARALESMREEVERILTEKLAVLQSQLEVSQHAAPPPEELANNQASLQAISEKMQSLMTSLQNLEASRKQDALEILEILRAEMEGKISNDLEAAKRSWSEENLLKIDSEQGEHSNFQAGRLPKSQHYPLETSFSEKALTFS
eukprot:XP_027303493.1 titin homolog [Anas platyrhynchos]